MGRGRVKRVGCLVTMGQGNRRREGGELAKTHEAREHRLLVKVARPGATASAQRVGALPSAHTVAEEWRQ
jgi:hypothetical protein